MINLQICPYRFSIVNKGKKLQNYKTMERNSVRFGLIAGLGVAIYQLLLYFINPEMIFGAFANVAWLIYLFSMWRAASLDKEEKGGYISFKEAFTTAFTVFANAALIALVFQHVLMTVIDPGLLEIQKEISLEAFDKVADTFGLEEGSKEYEAGLEEIRKNSSPTLMQLGMGYIVVLIIGSVPALIMAAVMKKEAPMAILDADEYEDITNE